MICHTLLMDTFISPWIMYRNAFHRLLTKDKRTGLWTRLTSWMWETHAVASEEQLEVDTGVCSVAWQKPGHCGANIKQSWDVINSLIWRKGKNPKTLWDRKAGENLSCVTFLLIPCLCLLGEDREHAFGCSLEKYLPGWWGPGDGDCSLQPWGTEDTVGWHGLPGSSGIWMAQSLRAYIRTLQ